MKIAMGLLVAAQFVRGFQTQSAKRASLSLNVAVEKSVEEWREQLTPEQFYVLREEGTEAPNSSPLNDIKESGTFVCAGCGEPLFTTDAKFDSGTGWPSFYKPIDAKAIDTQTDFKLLVPRTECLCANCGGHLGHVFDDGPEPTGQRFCMNGVAMQFTPAESDLELAKLVKERSDASPYRMSMSQVLPSVATNGLMGVLFFNSFLKTLQVHGGSMSSPVDAFPLFPALFFGVSAIQSIKRTVSD